MFLTLKRKGLLAFLCAVVLVVSTIVYFTAIKPTFQPKPAHVIVIDAGHGGIDNGTSGVNTKVKESDLNLAYSKTLKSMFEDLNFKVVLTRKSSAGLYDSTASNKKKSEMEKRKSIIDKSGASLVISVHMNSFKLPSCQGAQVFYAKGNDEGNRLAQSVQTSLHEGFPNSRSTATVGDYFVLNCTSLPAILVEFGFLSNPQEEILLQKEDYMKKMCYFVVGGVLNYLQV